MDGHKDKVETIESGRSDKVKQKQMDANAEQRVNVFTGLCEQNMPARERENICLSRSAVSSPTNECLTD